MSTLAQAIPRVDRANLLAIVLGAGMAFYLAIEPTQPWLLLLVAGLAALGTDGVLRSHPASPFTRPDDTVAFLFLPALLALGGGLFLEDVVSGYWSVLVAIATIPLFAVLLYGQYLSVDARSPAYTAARLVANVATYVTAFAFFAVAYEFEVDLLPAAFCVGVVSLLLSLEMLREVELGPRPTLLYSMAIALLLAQATWALHFLPLESFLAAAFLLLCLYIATGVVQNHLLRQLDLETATEFAAVALVGLAIVVIAHAAS
ncbi:MAG: hypothetical protein AMJ77_05615 [Dehalococcoidia bacterium SM23_28_2]|nr:MAG: hypothetical protein AMJ77_05615 [Dehalococcoidia bacterium SM23_28_2]